MNVLITGGAGFLGSHLAERLLKDGNHVFLVDNFCTGQRKNLVYLQNLQGNKNLLFIEADVIMPWDAWTPSLPPKVDLIFHFASPASPPHYQRLALETMWVNSLGLSRALEFADQRKGRVVFASTSEIYGDPEISPQPESYWGNVNTVGPRSCYDEAKRFGEALIYTHNMKWNTNHGLVRIFNTYGPRMNPTDGRVIINFLVQALRGEKLTVYGDGQQTRSFCYVDDLIDGIILYAQSSITRPVNLGNDAEFSILEAAQAVQGMFPQKKLDIVYQDLPADDPKQRRPDLSTAKAELKGWSPKINLEEGLRRMLSDLKSSFLEAQ